MSEIFIEAESFKNLVGWVIDQQSMETIHSSYIMAHGMGVPVKDAVTEFDVSVEDEYNLWVLTRDWTSVWNVKESVPLYATLPSHLRIFTLPRFNLLPLVTLCVLEFTNSKLIIFPFLY